MLLECWFKVRRAHLFYFVLFLMTYALSSFYYWHVGQRVLMGNKSPSQLRTDVAVSNKMHSLSSATQEPSEQAVNIKTGNVQSHQNPSASEPPSTSANEWSTAAQRQVSVLSETASSAESATDRGKAILKLGYIEKTPQSVQTLTNALNSDQSEQNRVLAVTSLLDMARQDDEGGAIKSALTRALSDQSPRVSARARAALESLSAVE